MIAGEVSDAKLLYRGRGAKAGAQRILHRHRFRAINFTWVLHREANLLVGAASV